MKARRVLIASGWIGLVALGALVGYSLAFAQRLGRPNAMLFTAVGAALVGIGVTLLYACRDRLALALPPGPFIPNFLIAAGGLLLGLLGWLVAVFFHVRTGALIGFCGWMVVGLGQLRYFIWKFRGRDG